jgi:serine/threonine-protein kinase
MSDAFPLAPTEDKRLGMVLQDKYRIVRKIGEGGMGSVYEAEHVLIKRRVAIKCLHAHFTSNEELVARFHREALAATAVGNEHIIEVTDMGALPDGTIFMVLEYLDGRDFASVLDTEGPQRIDRVMHVAAQVCDALVAAHAKGIVHRDLKPENVFLIRRGDAADFVKVLDFGISKFRDSSLQVGSGMTKTGTTMGTPWYMAPEQAEGRKDIDHRVDLYALGVMLFRALAGRHPFDAETYPKLVMSICNDPPPSLRSFRPDVPEELDAIIRRLLAKQKEERFDDAGSLKAALAPFRPFAEPPVFGAGMMPPAPAALGLAATTPSAPHALAGRGEIGRAHV